MTFKKFQSVLRMYTCWETILDRQMDFASVVGSYSKEFTCNAGDSVWVPGSGRSSGEGNGNPLQYSCLEKSLDGFCMFLDLACFCTACRCSKLTFQGYLSDKESLKMEMVSPSRAMRRHACSPVQAILCICQCGMGGMKG